jgi:tripeptide aminopeptidase
VEAATLKLIIRDHDLQMFELRKATIQRLVRYLNEKYGSGTLTLELKDSYFNMRDRILPVYHVIETAREVMESLGIQPIIKPIRGGTDGARLSFMGLPTPNLFTGGHNYHGKYEYIPIPSMVKAVDTLVGILSRYAEI